MLKTKQRKRKQISDLKMDLEIINPIESKTILGGDLYDPLGYDWEPSAWAWNGYRNPYEWIPVDYGGNGDGSGSGSGSGGGSGGSGGGGGGGDDTFYYPDPEFPDHICQQPANSATCATIALSYVANYFGATGLTSSDFAEMAGQNYDAMHYGIGGLTGDNLSTIMTNVFQSTIIDGSTASIESNLRSGNPILATIVYNNGGGHEVVITEFDAYAGKVSFMDSISGTKVVSNISDVSFTSQLYAVTGIQNNATVNQYKNDTNDVSYCTICAH
jgi:hypothetical protein